MIRVCLLMIAGGYAAQHIRLPVSSDLCKLLLVASIAALAWRRSRYPASVILGVTLFLLAGQGIVDGRLDQRFAGDSLLTQVRITDFPKTTGRSVVMLVEPLNDRRLPPLSRVSWFEPEPQPSIGDVWELELRLKRPRGYSNPGVFDLEAWMFRQKIHATGYVVSGKRNKRLRTGTESAIERFRQRFVVRAALAADSPDSAAVLSAVGVGVRHLISRPQWHAYAVSGTSHLMAISGLHIGLAATVAYFISAALLGVLRVRLNTHVAAIVAGVIVASLYALVSGFGVPAERASAMLLVAACAVIRRRRIDPFATVAVAAIIVFILDPVATMTPGFSLSFSAVVLLLWLAQRRRCPAPPKCLVYRATDTMRQLWTMQVFLFFGLVPFTVIIFQRVAILAMPVNFIAVPLFSVVTVPFTLLGLALGDAFAGPGALALRIAARSVEGLLALIEQVARLPFADMTVVGSEFHAWQIVLAPALWVVLPRGWPGRWLAPLAVVALILQTPQPPDRNCVDAHILDVGQGLVTVVQTRHATLVFDTGASFRDGGNVAEQVLVPFLRSRGIDRVDWLVVSHADSDHSGGVRTIHDYARIDLMLVGEPLRETDLASIGCAAGQYWEADGVGFRVLHPQRAAAPHGNDSSCVLLVSVGPHKLLLTGDIEANAERELVRSNELGVVDVVVVPHHGSLTSSSAPFVDAVSPIIAIVSAGFGNRWGLPKALVVERWQSVGAEVLDTAGSGAVSLRACAYGGFITVRRDRIERRRFWRDNTH